MEHCSSWKDSLPKRAAFAQMVVVVRGRCLVTVTARVPGQRAARRHAGVCVHQCRRAGRKLRVCGGDTRDRQREDKGWQGRGEGVGGRRAHSVFSHTDLFEGGQLWEIDQTSQLDIV